jgi:hypothetical protein
LDPALESFGVDNGDLFLIVPEVFAIGFAEKQALLAIATLGEGIDRAGRIGSCGTVGLR